MKYTVIAVYSLEGNEIHSDVKTTKYPDIAKSFFNNFAMLMKMDPLLGIKRVSLYADGNEIERTMIKYGRGNEPVRRGTTRS